MKLRNYVHVVDEEGRAHVFGPDDDVPNWAADKITNPRAWKVPPEADTSVAPPRHGPGSGKDAWRAYAEGLGIDVEASATRDDIMSAVDESAR